jgi:hypothetical protein
LLFHHIFVESDGNLWLSSSVVLPLGRTSGTVTVKVLKSGD